MVVVWCSVLGARLGVIGLYSLYYLFEVLIIKLNKKVIFPNHFLAPMVHHVDEG